MTDDGIAARTRATAERYLELASAGDADAIAALYAEDAVFLPTPPHDVILRGRDAIRRHYAEHVSGMHPVFEKLHWVVNGLECCVEIDATIPGEAAHSYIVDVFTMAEDGRIQRMAAYRRTTGD
jgi:uncharacterized protein (TIGR02246 family)